MFNPNTPAEDLPDPINMKVILDAKDVGCFLDTLSVSVPYPKILSERTADKTGDVLERNGRIIKCNIQNAPVKYFAWIPTTLVDALDYEKSTITKTAYVTTVRQAVLKEALGKV